VDLSRERPERIEDAAIGSERERRFGLNRAVPQPSPDRQVSIQGLKETDGMVYPRPDMKTFSSDGVELAYMDEGGDSGSAAAPEPVLLIHGFASNTATNWVDTGWVAVLREAGYRVIAFDNRGHGHSEKLYRLEDYGAPLMAEDARRLLDHLSIPRAHVIGYSMGARIAAFLALAHPERIASLVFGGLGLNMVRGMAGTGPIAHALEAPSVDDVKNPAARTFRLFAEQTKSDLRALAACIRSARAPITAEAVATLRAPVLVAVGEHDVVGGPAAGLAALIPGAEAFVIEGREHMKAVGDRTFKAAALAFLARHRMEAG
jgi:pimeloyl-ACP methyl ester carboxylesterase